MIEHELGGIYRDPEGPWWKWVVPRKINYKERALMTVNDLCTAGAVYLTVNGFRSGDGVVGSVGVITDLALMGLVVAHRLAGNVNIDRVLPNSQSVDYDWNSENDNI